MPLTSTVFSPGPATSRGSDFSVLPITRSSRFLHLTEPRHEHGTVSAYLSAAGEVALQKENHHRYLQHHKPCIA